MYETHCVVKSNLYFTSSSGLYYKHVTIVIDNSSIISKWSFKLIDDPSIVIYDRHRFIIQATGSLSVYYDLYGIDIHFGHVS
jgi:hypothetical protein